MKKLLILIATIGFSTAFAQQGRNGYYAEGNRGGNGYHNGQNQSRNYDARSNRGRRGYNGYQQRAYRNNNARGGVVNRGYTRGYDRGYNNYDSRRVVYRNHNRSGYRWRVTEERYYVPGYYTYANGCRRWIEPCFRWRTVNRTCVPAPRPRCW